MHSPLSGPRAAPVLVEQRLLLLHLHPFANPCGWQQVVAHTLSHPSVCFKPGKHYQPSARPARH